MKYDSLSIYDFCNILQNADGNYSKYGIDDNTVITSSEMYDYIKNNTDNFNASTFLYKISDIRKFAYIIRFSDLNFSNEPYSQTIEHLNEIHFNLYDHNEGWIDYSLEILNEHNSYFENFTTLIFEEQQSLRERIEIIYSEMPNLKFRIGIYRLLQFSDVAEREYKRITELAGESDPIFKGKRPNNTHNQQFALLEELGIIKFLKNEFSNLPDTKLSELIANIINRDIQNSRTMLSFTNTKYSESKQPKNKDVIDSILIKTGINKVD